MGYLEHEHCDLQNQYYFGFVAALLVLDDALDYAVDVDHPREHDQVHGGRAMAHRVPHPHAEQHQRHIVFCAVVQVGHGDDRDQQEKLIEGRCHLI